MSMINLRGKQDELEGLQSQQLVDLVKDMDDEWFVVNICLLNTSIDKLTKSLNYETKEFA